VQTLQLDFEVTAKLKEADKKDPMVPIKVFVEVLMGSFADGKFMETDIMKLGGWYRDEKKPEVIKVKNFLKGYESYQ
jgi:hypothetical protein